MQQVEGPWELMPDLRFAAQDIVVDGNKVAVRCIATGSPAGPFTSKQLDGTRSVRIDTIDIHEARDGQIVRVQPLEDRATALEQLG